MRKWKKGAIASAVLFTCLISDAYFPEIEVVQTVSAFGGLLSSFILIGLVFVFVLQLGGVWPKRFSPLSVQEKIVKTKIVGIYECAHCMRQYSDSQICPHCGSPYRRTLKETTEEEIIEKWKK